MRLLSLLSEEEYEQQRFDETEWREECKASVSVFPSKVISTGEHSQGCPPSRVKLEERERRQCVDGQMRYLVLHGQHQQAAHLHQHRPTLRQGAQRLGLVEVWTGAGARRTPRLLGWRHKAGGGGGWRAQ